MKRTIRLLLPAFTFACLQTELTQISLGQVATDFLTNSDELTVILSAGDDLAYSLQSVFSRNSSLSLPPVSVSFPCFQEDVLSIQLEESDPTQNDKARIALDCKNLQLGLNKIEVNLYEDGGVFNDAAQVLKAIWGWTFGFKDEIPDNQHPAVYSFMFNVTDKCTALYFDPSQVRNAKIMLFTNVDESTLEERIKKEEAAPEPLIILADGSSVTLSSVSLKLSSFIEPKDLAVNFSIVKTKPKEEVKIESGVVWWYIALPVLVVVLVVVAMGIVFYFQRKNSLMAKLHEIQQSQKGVDTEKEGVQLPDQSRMEPRVNSSRRKIKGEVTVEQLGFPEPRPLESEQISEIEVKDENRKLRKERKRSARQVQKELEQIEEASNIRDVTSELL